MTEEYSNTTDTKHDESANSDKTKGKAAGWELAPPAGIEPATNGLTASAPKVRVRCSYH